MEVRDLDFAERFVQRVASSLSSLQNFVHRHFAENLNTVG